MRRIAYRVEMNDLLARRDAPADPSAVASPCIGVCRIGRRDYCVGCGRSLDEIGAWLRASDAQRLAIRERAAARLQVSPE